MKENDQILQTVKNLPGQPGVYQYYDVEGILLYIGKAKNLKKRVTSYFKEHDSARLNMLVRKIADIKYIIVNTEFDALLLENTLIKKHQPRYNVMLKDDKTYPWICVKNEPFPRVFSTRNIVRDGSKYFGPYASVKMMHTLLDLVKKLYPLRSCSLPLTPENISRKKFKVCLEFHIGNCKAPCESLQSAEDYDNAITQIKNILKGNIAQVVDHLHDSMNEFSSKMEFEKAQLLKDKIEILKNYQSKSLVVHPSITDADVFTIKSDDKCGYVNYLKVINGAIIQGHTIELKKKLDETEQELFQMAIVDLRSRFESEAKEVIVPFAPEIAMPGVSWHVPERGDKKKLVELSERNLDYFIHDKRQKELLVDPERHTKRILAQMMKDLHLKEEPRHIECFDNSNIQGAYPVAAMTVFKDLKPSKKDYRHFNIKTVEGPNDFASMEEVIFRRYKRVIEENASLPQLIVIDGGKGQLSSAMESLKKLKLDGKVAVIGIAKKLEEIYFPGDSLPLYINKKSESLKIIQQIRDEAHRFGITHHRNKRSKGTIKTELTEIKGISDITVKKLLQHFKSVKRVKEASLEELTAIVGRTKALIIRKHYGG